MLVTGRSRRAPERHRSAQYARSVPRSPCFQGTGTEGDRHHPRHRSRVLHLMYAEGRIPVASESEIRSPVRRVVRPRPGVRCHSRGIALVKPRSALDGPVWAPPGARRPGGLSSEAGARRTSRARIERPSGRRLYRRLGLVSDPGVDPETGAGGPARCRVSLRLGERYWPDAKQGGSATA
jgi:hypothetical protein